MNFQNILKLIKMGPKEEFIQLMTDNVKVNGFSDLTSKIIGILFAEPDEISLEELSKRTGYSLSSISTEVKITERMGLVKRIKKPGSRKVYFSVERDFMKTVLELIKKKQENIVLKSKGILPGIIKNYKSKKLSKKEKKELRVVEDYYKTILAAEKLFEKMMEMFIKYKMEVEQK